jgi:hypothetical protein
VQSLGGRAERGIDAEVELETDGGEPGNAALTQMLRFLDHAEAKELTIESARGVLATGRDGDLDGPDGRDCHGRPPALVARSGSGLW